MVPQIHILRTADGADFPLPSYTSKHHVGLNLMAAIAKPIKINPRERVRIPVGFAFAIPDGLCGQVISLSQLALEHGIIVIDAPSLINPADHAPLFVLLRNESTKQFILRRGMVIAQMIIVPVVQVAWQEIKIEDKSELHTSNMTQVYMDDEDNVDENEIETKDASIHPLGGVSKRPHVSIRGRGTKS